MASNNGSLVTSFRFKSAEDRAAFEDKKMNDGFNSTARYILHLAFGTFDASDVKKLVEYVRYYSSFVNELVTATIQGIDPVPIIERAIGTINGEIEPFVASIERRAELMESLNMKPSPSVSFMEYMKHVKGE